jgi:hypothetical protein
MAKTCLQCLSKSRAWHRVRNGANGLWAKWFWPQRSKSWAQRCKHAKGEVSKLKNMGCSKIKFGASRSSRQLDFLRSINSSSLGGITVAKSFYITFSKTSKYSAFERKESEERKCIVNQTLLYSFFTINASFFPAIYCKLLSCLCMKFVSLWRFKLTCFYRFLYEITITNVC